MSLIHWWKLRDLDDSGINRNIPENTNTTFSNEGKLGFCINFTSNSSHLKINNLAELCKLKKYTLSCWVNIKEPAENHSSSFLSSGDWNNSTHQICFAAYNYSSSNKAYMTLLVPNTNGWGTGINLESANYIYLNKWTHILITHDGYTTKGYINGNYAGETHANAGFPTSTNVPYYYLGAATYYSGFTMHGQMADFRIYNDNLSLREIHNIYNTCILHYDFNSQYIEPTENIAIGQYKPAKSSHVITGKDNIGEYFIRDSGSSYYSGIYLPSIPIPNGTNRHYTISFEIMCPDSEFSFGYDTNDYSNEYGGNDATRSAVHNLIPHGKIPANTWAKFAYDIVYKDDATNVRAAFQICPQINEHKIYYRNVQYEKKDHFTPYVNGIRSGICYDASGYQYNSNVRGNIIYSHDSGIGHGSVKFNNNSLNAIYCENFPQIKQNITYNCWCKQLGTSNNQYIMSQGRDCGSVGINIRTNKDGHVRFHIGTGSSGTNQSKSVADMTISDISILNEWHMITITYDGTNVIIYCDGINKGSRALSEDIDYRQSQNALVFGKMAYAYTSTVSYFPFDGLIADASVYATALSADDIKKLYRSKATLHENYKLELNSFIENGSSFNNEIQQKYAFLNEKSVFDMVSLIEPARIKLDDNSEWLCIFSHDLRYQNQYYSKLNSESQVCLNQDNRYSLLKYLDSSIFRKDGISSGKYEFILEYPEIGMLGHTNEYNRWKQSANPITTPADTSRNISNMGYEAIHISWDQAWGYGIGLSTNGEQVYLDCQAGKGTWYGAIGQYSAWTDTQNFPAPNWSDKNFVRLWVRIDGTGYKGWFKTYDNGEILVSKIQER